MSYVVAIIVDDRVLASSSDDATVRLAASLIAQRPDHEASPAFEPITKGRQVACRMLAAGAV
jgi:hypothetical protein